MHDLKDLRKNLNTLKKKFQNRNIEFDIDNFNKIDTLNRNLISKKEKLEQEKKLLSKSQDKSNFSKSKKISEEISSLIKEHKEVYKMVIYVNNSINHLFDQDIEKLLIGEIDFMSTEKIVE